MIRPGDSVVLASLFQGYFPWKDEQALSRSQDDFEDQIGALSDSLREKGASLVIFGPMPRFTDRPDINIPLTICSEEWYRPKQAMPPECLPATISRSDYEQSIRPYRQLIDRIAAKHENVHIYEPSDVICPASQENCSTHNGGNMVFFDSNHLTNYGALSLHPSFMRFMQSIR
jgi:hypothetical protein